MSVGMFLRERIYLTDITYFTYDEGTTRASCNEISISLARG